MVTSFFTHEQNWEIDVTNSIGLGANDGINFIKDATVNVLDENSDLIEILSLKTYSFPGYPNTYKYLTNLPNKSMEGKTYKIEVSAPSFETVYTESYIPIRTEVANFSRTSNTLANGTTEGTATLQFQDKRSEDNYYQVYLSQAKFRIDTNSVTGDPDTVFVSSSNSKLTSYNLETAEPRINRKYLFISDKSFNGNLHSFTFNYKLENDSTPSGNNNLYRTFVSLATVSIDNYKYYTSIAKLNAQENNPFAQPVRVYSNIENGFGIFAGHIFASNFIYSNTR